MGCFSGGGIKMGVFIDLSILVGFGDFIDFLVVFGVVGFYRFFGRFWGVYRLWGFYRLDKSEKRVL